MAKVACNKKGKGDLFLENNPMLTYIFAGKIVPIQHPNIIYAA